MNGQENPVELLVICGGDAGALSSHFLALRHDWLGVLTAADARHLRHDGIDLRCLLFVLAKGVPGSTKAIWGVRDACGEVVRAFVACRIRINAEDIEEGH